MGIKCEVQGVGDVVRKLDRLVERARSVGGTVPVSDLLTRSFMRRHAKTAHPVEEWFLAGGFSVSSQADLEAVSESELDAHVRATTMFGSWSEMLAAAGREYVTEKMRR
jgi:hypothetical protein